ncbi:MAG: hypothetical protein Q9191_000460 [Dirinaria sp. TL-2023a]
MSERPSVAVNGFSHHDGARQPENIEPRMPIAILGMACRLPGDVSDLESFWNFCQNASNSWTEFPKERVNPAAFHHPNPEKAGCFHLKGAHFLQSSVSCFDAPFFNITAEEAKSVDPRHRMLLECTYEALENSGIPISSIVGKEVGVYVGRSLSHYELHCLRDFETAPRLQYMECADSLLANRISYFFDLRGPSATIDTACSSGLAALHLACQSLRAGEISQAIVGGSHLNLMPEVLASVSSSMFYSAEGKCYPFDERVSGGFGPGEGTSCMVLKPLQGAIDSGDNIRAIIRNTGGIDSYIEAHGTGTTVGDPLEAAAFTATIGKKATPEDPIFIGSAKSNFGHLEGVSGIVSIIKAAMMLENRMILPNANFETPNPKISSLEQILKVPTSAFEWASTGVRRVSVNNLGFGGSNAHAILEEASGFSDRSKSTVLSNGNRCQIESRVPIASDDSDVTAYLLFVLTANDETSVKVQMQALIRYLEKRRLGPTTELMRNLAFTLGQRRSLLPWKIAIPALTAEDLIGKLESREQVPTRTTKVPKLGFVFTGQGANWQGMGQELFQTYAVFSSAIAAADRHLPACTAIQLALVQLLHSWGIRPQSVTGHSSGEIAAAFAAGAPSFESCLSIAYYRGIVVAKLKDNHPEMEGAMLAIGTSHEDANSMIEELRNGQAVVACINSPFSVTASGDLSAIDELQSAAEKTNLFTRKLPVDVAYHSPHMDLVAEEYRKAIGNVKPASSKSVQFFSSLMGRKVNTLALGSSYWVSNLKSHLEFASSLLNCCSLDEEGSKLQGSVTHLVEIGPHSALKGPIRDILSAAPKTKQKIGYSSVLVRKQNAAISALNMASELVMKGCYLDMSAVNFPQKASKPKLLLNLPPYPWNHETEFWHESRISQDHRMKPRPRNDILGTLAVDSNDLEPRWRNIIRLDDIPWLRHHRVRSNAVFPFAGYVAMAVEAKRQHVETRIATCSKIELRNISNNQPLVILEGVDVEIMLTLRPLDENSRTSSESWDAFKIFSWTESAGWIEHCRGQVAALSDKKSNDVEAAHLSGLVWSLRQDPIREVESACVSKVDSRKIYEAVSKLGIDYGPCMTMLADCCTGGQHAMGSVQVPDTAATMPRLSETPLIVHPAFLDNCLQVAWPLLGAGQTEMKGLYLPTFVKNLCVRLDTRAQNFDHVKVFGATEKSQYPSERLIESILVIDPNEPEMLPAITFDGLTMVSLSDGHSAKEKREKSFYSKIHWEPCLDLLGSKEFQDHFRLPAAPDEEMSTVKDLERAALFYFEIALKNVTDAHYNSLQDHHKRLYRLMQKQLESAKKGENPVLEAQWDASSDSERKEFLEMVRARGVSGELTCKIGERISDILLSGLDTLSLMLEDGLLEKFCRHSAPLIRNNEQAALLVDSLAHRNPHLRVLEIGAGTGGVTLSVLEKLDGVSGQVPRFQDYIFTDISSRFFENAQEKLKAWSTLVTYRKLNIEEDPISQDFESEAFDLVIAANVLHATTRMTRTLSNVRKLLKPDGKLLLVEITTTRAQFFPFGTLPGWWAGFSGLDRSLHDYPEEVVHSHSVMLSTASVTESCEAPKDLILIQSHPSSRLSLEFLKERLSAALGRAPWVLSLAQISHLDVKDSHCIFLDELERPILSNLPASDFQAIQNLCSAAGILWVVQGGQMESSTPESSMAVGLARCIRSENPAIRLVTLDLDEKQKLQVSCTSEVIANLYQAVFTPTTHSGDRSPEAEYLERDESQAYLEGNRALALEIGTPGLLETFYFTEDETIGNPLKPDDVQIQVKASALNFRDVMAALGKVPCDSFGNDCAGVISAVGDDASDLKVGDRVCALATAAFATVVRCAASYVVRIPETTNFNDAASLPVICTTVYHSLVNVARLCKGETVLIHAAAGGVGQAAIMLSQSIGAEIFATVGNARKKEFIMTRYGLREDHIFFSRDIFFENGIMDITRKRGVDVALNSLSGDALRATWRCLAHFGRFVEMGKSDILANNTLEMQPFLQNRTYAAVDLLSLSYEKPALMKDLLLKLIDLHSKGVFRPVFSITIFPYSKIETAFRTMQSGDNIGKIVLRPQLEDYVKIMPRNTMMSSIRPEATYVITGGSGGLAYSFARWLTDQGAKCIVLASRSGKADSNMTNLIEELRGHGTMLLPHKCDVTNKQQVNDLVGEGLSHLPPILGVIHGAMDNRSAFFENYTHEEFMAVIRPKVEGAWNLHNTLLNNKLDFFVSFASVTGLIGNHGQSAYCATTTFLEAFASYRASLGLAASTIDLGAVTDVGYLAVRGPDLQDQMRNVIGAEINEKELLAILDAAISGRVGKDSNYATITGLQCTGNDAQSFWSHDPLFSHMRGKNRTRQRQDVGAAAASSAWKGLAEAESLATARKVIYDCLAAKFSTVLMIDEEDLSPDKALGAYGTDSLVAVELRNWIGREMEATVILMDLLADNTLATLTETVFQNSKLSEHWRAQN